MPIAFRSKLVRLVVLSCSLALGVALAATPARATVVNVTLDTTALAGTPGGGVLAFDFIDGDATANNSVVLSTVSNTGGTALSPVIALGSDITGTGPWTFSDTGSFFSTLYLGFDPLGSSFSFSFDTTNNLVGATPDSFVVSLLDSMLAPLVATFDPDTGNPGTGVLLSFDLGVGDAGLHVFTTTDLTINASVAATVPEPPTSLLLLAALAALGYPQFGRWTRRSVRC